MLPNKVRLSKSDEALIPDDPTESSRGRTLDRVHAVLRGELDADQLEPDEARIFHDFWSVYMAGPNPERDAFVAKMHAEGGYAGEDDQAPLVRTPRGQCGTHDQSPTIRSKHRAAAGRGKAEATESTTLPWGSIQIRSVQL